MNRLWVRFALVVTAIIFLITLLPLAYGTAVEAGLLPEPASFRMMDDLLTYFPPDVQARFVERMQNFARIYFARAFMAAAVIGILAGAWLGRMLAAPLQELEQGAQAIAGQELSHRVPERGSQEIQSVARAFNQMAGQLEQAEALRRNLLADVAHELRHPLHILQGNLQAILDGVYPLETAEIARLLDQTQHLTALVNDLHELAQAEARQLPLHKQVHNVAALVKETAVVFKPLAAEQGVELRVELLGAPPHMQVDPDRLRQAVNNLLQNALTHTPPGGCVTVRVAQIEAGCEIQVQDTGAGIAPEQLPHVFDRFYRTDGARSRDLGGTGLGLAVVKAIVEAHAGTVRVSSPGEGQGSTFVIRLPAAD